MNGSTSLRSHVAELAAAYQSKPFKPRTGVRIAITEAENADVNSDANLDSGIFLLLYSGVSYCY